MQLSLHHRSKLLLEQHHFVIYLYPIILYNNTNIFFYIILHRNVTFYFSVFFYSVCMYTYSQNCVIYFLFFNIDVTCWKGGGKSWAILCSFWVETDHVYFCLVDFKVFCIISIISEVMGLTFCLMIV